MALKLVYSAPPKKKVRAPFMIAAVAFALLGGPVVIPRLIDPAWEAESNENWIVEVHERQRAVTLRHRNTMVTSYSVTWQRADRDVVTTVYAVTRFGHLASPARKASLDEELRHKKYFG